MIEIRDVALAARGGGAVGLLAPDRIAALSAGLTTLDLDATAADSGVGGREAGEELRPLFVLARQ